ncbi:hypothetical protein EVAR_89913_1 [Eumeta japonica]|uniref:Uncharacterized protein n=1 Tax=Eumeta variegata TaxID=151549 RepID=A0A4C1XQI7_EUMVA|nr:hypothetical protein EVAR_89913_1 [Eumeta japonica]
MFEDPYIIKNKPFTLGFASCKYRARLLRIGAASFALMVRQHENGVECSSYVIVLISQKCVDISILWLTSSCRLCAQLTIHFIQTHQRYNFNEPKLDGRRLITEFLWPPPAPSSDPGYHSIKVLVKTNQTSPNSMGLRRLITEFLWPPSAPSSDADYHIVSKYSSRGIKRAQTRWGCVV